MIELKDQEIDLIAGGKADFSGVTSTVTSTAHMVDRNAELAKSIQLWMLVR